MRDDELTVDIRSARKAASSRLPGFHKLRRSQRLALLNKEGWLEDHDLEAMTRGGLSEDLLEHISENVVTHVALPVGLVTNVIVDGIPRLVPMATEEASVVAACCKAARIAAEAGGIRTVAGQRMAGAQVLFRTAVSRRRVSKLLREHQERFVADAQAAHPRMTAAGGCVLGVVLQDRHVVGPGLLTFMVFFSPGDAMGANIGNDLAERFGRFISSLVPGEVIGAVTTNAAFPEPPTATVSIPVAALATKGMAGAEAADRIALLCRWAEVDPYRFVTHDKGILNGVHGVLNALYQDTRASAMTWISEGRTPLARWTVSGGRLLGRYAGCCACSTVGGTGPHAPTTAIFYRLMKVERAADLERVLAAIGLLQNLGALHALATDGIRAGHMRLHARKAQASARAGQAPPPRDRLV